MQQIEIKTKIEKVLDYVTIEHPDYPVHLGLGVSEIAGTLIQNRYKGDRLFVVADANAMRLHGETLFSSLGEKYQIRAMVLPEGESCKTAETALEIVDFFVEENAHRDEVVVAFGGGVTGDLTGFAASMYLRGIRYIQIPTTLMAQVDSSIGGKVGVNLENGKNLLGSFHNPMMVLTDPKLLATLKVEDWHSGISEILKYGFTLEPEILTLMPEKLNTTIDTGRTTYEHCPQEWLGAIERAIRTKVEVVAADPKEQGLRQVLNFGHTIGHGLEKLVGYGRISHGRAVALGMLAEVQYGQEQMGMTNQPLIEQLEAWIERYGLRGDAMSKDYSVGEWTAVLRHDKKNSQHGLAVVFPKALGIWKAQRTSPERLAAFAANRW